MSGDPAWEQPAAGRRRWPSLLALVGAAALVAGLLARGPGPATLEVVEGDAAPPVEPAPPAEPDADGVGRWRAMAPAPIVRRTGHSAVWTGEEVLIWGGIRTDPRPHAPEVRMLGQGAAYRAQRDVWRRLPAAPIAPRHNHVAAWTGREMLVWGGSASGPGAAYNPRTNQWRVLADGPLDTASGTGGVWTGQALIVWTGGPAPTAAAYRPEDDTWTLLPDLPDDLPIGTALPGPPPPAVAQLEAATLVEAGGRLVLWDGAGGLVRQRGAEHWEPLAPAPLERRRGAVLVWASDRLVVWGGADAPRHFADGAVLRLPPYGSGSRMTQGG